MAEVLAAKAARKAPRVRGWMPVALMLCLMVAVGAYGAAQSPAFLTTYNVNSVLLAALPLALIAIGQTNALLVGGFDISVGALVTLCVVTASFTVTAGNEWYVLLPGSLALIGVALATGLLNATLILKVGLPSIIATLATLSVLQGIALRLRPVPGGEIDGEVMRALQASVGFMPYAVIGTIVLAIVWDMWLYRSPAGLRARAVGLDADSARRLGTSVRLVHWRAYVTTSVMAAVGAFFVAAQVGVGDAKASTAASYTLQSIAAAVLGGASLRGGRGSFVGALAGSIFLAMIVNVITLLGYESAWEQISMGVLTLLALLLYQGAEIFDRVRKAWTDMRRLRRRTPDSAAGRAPGSL